MTYGWKKSTTHWGEATHALVGRAEGAYGVLYLLENEFDAHRARNDLTSEADSWVEVVEVSDGKLTERAERMKQEAVTDLFSHGGQDGDQ